MRRVEPPALDELLRVMEQCSNHQGKVAQHYGVTRPTVHLWRRTYGLHIADRSTRQELDELVTTMHDILEVEQPMTVRQMFYRLVTQSRVKKTEDGYDQVARELVKAREDGIIPWGWITDHSRWVQKPQSWRDVHQYLDAVAESYLRDVWQDQPVNVQVWVEKDALAATLYDVTGWFDVGLFVAKGYSSLTYLNEAAVRIKKSGKPTFIYALADWDPSGVVITEQIESRLRQFAPRAEIHFERLAVIEPQIEQWNLPMRPTKKLINGFEGDSVELDAIAPDDLRGLVRTALSRHLPQEAIAANVASTRWDRQQLRRIADEWQS